MPKKITLLGATGTIGQNTISLVKDNPDKFSIETVIANNNAEGLAQIAKEVGAKNAVIVNQDKYKDLKKALAGTNIKSFSGEQDLLDLSSEKTDLYISAAVGFCALKPTLQAIKSGSKIGLANKECMVCAGDLMMKEADRNNCKIIPIDSEHNSIYQVFDFNRIQDVERVTLTASGGPFIGYSYEQLKDVTPQMAVKHPNWNMGAKISVDSATLMNKGLEVIEAFYLFPVEAEKIDVLVHPQSVIHGLVTYNDGSMLAGISGPDMRIPIAYALAHPERIKNNHGKISLADIGKLTFEKPDSKNFKCLELALSALKMGQICQISLNAVNEVAVQAFLDNRISFNFIPELVEQVVEKMLASNKNKVDDLQEIFDIDSASRRVANNILKTNKLTEVVS